MLAEPDGSAAAARSCSVGSKCVAPGDRSRQWRVAYPVAAGAVRGLTKRRLPGTRVAPLRCDVDTNNVYDLLHTHANVSPRALKRHGTTPCTCVRLCRRIRRSLSVCNILNIRSCFCARGTVPFHQISTIARCHKHILNLYWYWYVHFFLL